MLAAHADRRSTVAALAGSIAHELSQPLGSILHNVYAAERMLASGPVTADTLQDILRDIRNDDTRAVQIVQRHRVLLQKRDMERAPVDLHSVVCESLAVLADEAVHRQVRIDAALEPISSVVVGDRVLLQQAVVNLVLNAIDAIDDAPPERRCVTVRTRQVTDGVEIAVEDSGPGLAPELAATAFEPFVTTKQNGVGIGLTIVRGIIEAHGGTITASNNPGGGATFQFTLPPDGAVLTTP